MGKGELKKNRKTQFDEFELNRQWYLGQISEAIISNVAERSAVRAGRSLEARDKRVRNGKSLSFGRGPKSISAASSLIVKG